MFIIIGPGIKSPEERTMEYLEDVAVNTARSVCAIEHIYTVLFNLKL